MAMSSVDVRRGAAVALVMVVIVSHVPAPTRAPAPVAGVPRQIRIGSRAKWRFALGWNISAVAGTTPPMWISLISRNGPSPP
jgi:hypothetical protein